MKEERLGEGANYCAATKDKKSGGAFPTKPEKAGRSSGRRWIFFELLDVAFLVLLHEGFALEEVALEIGGKLAGDDEELVTGNFGKRNGAARGDEMRTPLEDEAGVPCNEEKKERGGGSEGAAR